MQRYDTYKDSGVQWLGEIPSHWEVKRFKHFGTFSKGKLPKNTNLDGMGFPIIGASEMNGKEPSVFTEDINVPHCLPYDILILWDGANAGLVANNKKGVVASTAVKYTCFDDSINNRYLFYLIKNYQRYYKDKVSGTTIPHMNIAFINDTPLLVPKYAEQTAIANFLDTATTKIDAAIAQQQKMIDLLNERKQIIINRAVTRGLNPNAKMKDSGVEWIGEVPEEWDFVRLKHLTKIISKGTTPSTIGKEILSNGNIRFLKAENIVNNSVCENPEFFIDETTHAILKRSNLQENDLLFVIAGATIGKVAILTKELTPANTNQAISFIRLNNPEMAKYIWYVLQSEITKKYIWLNAVQSAQPNISMEDLGNIQMPIPDVSIQNEIIDYIEAKVSPIENSIYNCQKQISLLQERKQIVINEVVTGKMKIL